MNVKLLKSRFEITRIIRRSAGVTAFVGHDLWRDNRKVYVKCLGSTSRDDEEVVEQIAWYRGLRHPAIGGLTDAGILNSGELYVTRDFYRGATPLGPVPSLVTPLLSAVEVLQRHGVVHGRLKANNVIAHADSVRIVDGGLPPTPIRKRCLGDTLCRAPELFHDRGPTPESDLYSLGCLIYWLISGRYPFEDSNHEILCEKIMHASPTPLTEVSRADESLSSLVVQGLLSRDPSRRVEAFQRLKSRTPATFTPASRTPMTGRAQELSATHKALVEEREGLRLVTVSGEAGIGKSRFIDELRLRLNLSKTRLFVGRCYERDNRPFEPILQALSQRFRFHDRTLRNWLGRRGRGFAPSLRVLLPEHRGHFKEIHNVPRAEKLASDLAGVIISLSREDPHTAFALEDLHWSDEGTLAVLTQILLRACETSLGLVVTYRTGALDCSLHGTLTELDPAEILPLHVPLGPLDPVSARIKK